MRPGGVTGYTVELAIQLEGLALQNGTQIGLEVEICDVAVEGETAAAAAFRTAPAINGETGAEESKDETSGGESSEIENGTEKTEESGESEESGETSGADKSESGSGPAGAEDEVSDGENSENENGSGSEEPEESSDEPSDTDNPESENKPTESENEASSADNSETESEAEESEVPSETDNSASKSESTEQEEASDVNNSENEDITEDLEGKNSAENSGINNCSMDVDIPDSTGDKDVNNNADAVSDNNAGIVNDDNTDITEGTANAGDNKVNAGNDETDTDDDKVNAGDSEADADDDKANAGDSEADADDDMANAGGNEADADDDKANAGGNETNADDEVNAGNNEANADDDKANADDNKANAEGNAEESITEDAEADPEEKDSTKVNDSITEENKVKETKVMAAAPQEAEGTPVRVGNIFWSHGQTSLYEDMNHEHPNAVDWGTVTLSGWNGTDSFAYSDWRLTNAIRYLDSIAFPKSVYTQESQAVLDAARARAEAVIRDAENGNRDIAASDTAAEQLEAAIRDLRWADTRYPDPDELPDQMTLPNPYKFFQSERMVKSGEDWIERRAEILDMAQFYEYGYKPGKPDDMTIQKIQHYNIGDKRTILFWGFWPMEVTVTCPTDVVTIDITVSAATASLDFTVYSPTEDQLQTSGHGGGPVPVVLSFDGDNEVYRNAGFAVVEVPAGSGGDGRSNEYAWGTRTGTFYTLYPYSRNGEGALKEVSSEMAAAWSATRVIDALEMMSDSTLDGAAGIASAVDPGKLAVTGFSINGKYAFVSAVFDERIDVCIPGAAGASGPSPWRYVYTGHEYDWSGTLFAAAEGSGVSSVQIASGTEMMANSIRHNRVRETELFRQFLTPGNFYKRLPGAYGYGTRLPYDQNDLIATLAPRAILLENTVNDYNDGCEADSLGLQIAKSVYNTLGYDGEDLIKFNQRPVQPGEPHGTDNAQKTRTAEYLAYYFYGEQMSEETDAYLNTDPFSLPVSNGGTQSPYDYYYGGFNTITGGQGGVDGRDGWYYYSFPEEPNMLDTGELNTLYQSLVNKSLQGYTEESAAAFRTALKDAESVLNGALEDTEENRALLNAVTEALRQANEGLVQKAQDPGREENPKSDDDDRDGDDDRDVFPQAVAVDWNAAAEQLRTAATGTNVNIFTGNKMEVPVNVLRNIAGKKVTLALQPGNGFAFSISGNELKKADSPFVLTVSAAANIPEAVRREVLTDAYTSREFVAEGTGMSSLPVNLHINFGVENAGRKAFLYYYDEAAGAMRLTGSFIVTENGQAMFRFNRGGRYIAVIAEQAVYGSGSYTVVKGDTLSRIAVKHGIPMRTLIRNNPHIRDINKIYPGQEIRIQ